MLSPFLKTSDHCIAPPSRPFDIWVIDYDLLFIIWSMHELLEMSPEFKSTFMGLFSQASVPHVLPVFNCSTCLPIFHLLLWKLGLYLSHSAAPFLWIHLVWGHVYNERQAEMHTHTYTPTHTLSLLVVRDCSLHSSDAFDQWRNIHFHRVLGTCGPTQSMYKNGEQRTIKE